MSLAETLPNIPRLYTGLAEWAAVAMYVSLGAKRISGWRLPAVLGIALAAQIAIQAGAGLLPIGLWMPGMLAAVAVMYASVRVTAKGGPREAGYLTARAFVLAELVASLQWQLQSYFFPAEAPEPSLPMSVLLLVVVYVTAFGLSLLVERRHFAPAEPQRLARKESFGSVAIAAATFLVSNISFVSVNTPFSARLDPEIFYIRTLVDLCGFVALYAQRDLQARNENSVMKSLLNSQHAIYLQSRRSMDAVNKTYHDLKHQIGIIRAEADPGRKDRFLARLEDSVREYEAQIHTGNGVLDAILTAKSMSCAERGITFTRVVDGQAVEFMDVMDICTIFGNALDNAIESVIQVPDPDRRLISMAVYGHESFVVMTFENYFEGALRYENGELSTSKPDSDIHGYGIKNIRSAAERYGGTATVNTHGNRFTLRVLVPAESQVITGRGQ